MRTLALKFHCSARLVTATAVGLVALVTSAVPASASIIGGTIISGSPGAAFVKLSVPFTESTPDNTVGNDTFQSNNLYGFDEDQNIVLGGPLTVDIVPGGPLTLPVGTTVASHYIFFDPVTGTINGTVDFDSRIVAIITTTDLLLASDFLANTGVTYLNPGLRGLEPGDVATISGAQQIRLVASASTPGDYIRVLTEYSPGGQVPEPATLALVALGMVAAGLRGRATR